MYIHTCIHNMYMHTYIHTYIHTYTHKYIYTYIHIYTSRSPPPTWAAGTPSSHSTKVNMLRITLKNADLHSILQNVIRSC